MIQDFETRMLHDFEARFDQIKLTTHVDKLSGARTVDVQLSFGGTATICLYKMGLYDGETLTLGNIKGVIPIKSEFSKEEILNPKLNTYSMSAKHVPVDDGQTYILESTYTDEQFLEKTLKSIIDRSIERYTGNLVYTYCLTVDEIKTATGRQRLHANVIEEYRQFFLNWRIDANYYESFAYFTLTVDLSTCTMTIKQENALRESALTKGRTLPNKDLK